MHVVIKPVNIITFLLLISTCVYSQQNIYPSSSFYQWPTEPEVRAKLEHWRDQKFGIILHWGLYSVPGIVESWNLCSEDWVDRDSTMAYEDYKKWYWGLKERFNPTRFDPDRWAAIADSAGMKYLVFTTKHHDGFSMFDTRQSDFKITSGPFARNSKSNVAKEVFNAFRTKGFMIGSYFSKPDWHSENYWWPKYATADRNNNYDIRKFPWRWNKFKEFVFSQINELMTGYGSVDILWLDGGWVRPLETVNDEVRSWGARIPEWSQDIDLPRIAAMARKAQPGILLVDRTVHGPYENYQTPEQRIPQTQLDHPWESCMTLANNWGYVPGDKYKSATNVIHNLVEVVAKGGNLLLGVGPKPDGSFPEEATTRLKEIGSWMARNGSALYNTRTAKHYQEGNIWFTKNAKTNKCYALLCVREEESVPREIVWHENLPRQGSKMILLDTGENVKWKIVGDSVRVVLPPSVLNQKKIPALALSYSPAN